MHCKQDNNCINNAYSEREHRQLFYTVTELLLPVYYGMTTSKDYFALETLIKTALLHLHYGKNMRYLRNILFLNPIEAAKPLPTVWGLN